MENDEKKNVELSDEKLQKAAGGINNDGLSPEPASSPRWRNSSEEGPDRNQESCLKNFEASGY